MLRHAIVPVLRPYVRGMVAYDLVEAGSGSYLCLPSTGITFVLPVGEPLDVQWGDGTSRRTIDSCVSGLDVRPAVIRHGGVRRGVQLDLTPAGCRALANLLERLAGTEDWAERVALVEQRLLDQFARTGGPSVRIEVGGYADQADLTQEVTRFVGMPPTAWFRAKFPYLQDFVAALA